MFYLSYCKNALTAISDNNIGKYNSYCLVNIIMTYFVSISIIREIAEICIFIKYNDQWDHACKYVGGEIKRIMYQLSPLMLVFLSYKMFLDWEVMEKLLSWNTLLNLEWLLWGFSITMTFFSISNWKRRMFTC